LPLRNHSICAAKAGAVYLIQLLLPDYLSA
jgi:hypothetical protein